MADKKNKPESKTESKSDKKTTETVQLSADELRRISGGKGVSNPPPPKPGS